MMISVDHGHTPLALQVVLAVSFGERKYVVAIVEDGDGYNSSVALQVLLAVGRCVTGVIISHIHVL
jgi:hypothetical protein